MKVTVTTDYYFYDETEDAESLKILKNIGFNFAYDMFFGKKCFKKINHEIELDYSPDELIKFIKDVTNLNIVYKNDVIHCHIKEPLRLARQKT